MSNPHHELACEHLRLNMCKSAIFFLHKKSHVKQELLD